LSKIYADLFFISRFRIIDTDTFSTSKSSKKNSNEIDLDDPEELFATQEEKPFVAGIVDERPAQVILIIHGTILIQNIVFEVLTHVLFSCANPFLK
jgi:hypothetical protein